MESIPNLQSNNKLPDTADNDEPSIVIDDLISSVFVGPSTASISSEAKLEIETNIREILENLTQQHTHKVSEYKDMFSLIAEEKERFDYEVSSLREENEQLNEMSVNLISQIGKLKKYLDDSELLISVLRSEMSQLKREKKKYVQAIQDTINGTYQPAIKLLNDIKKREKAKRDTPQISAQRSLVLPRKRNSLKSAQLLQFTAQNTLDDVSINQINQGPATARASTMHHNKFRDHFEDRIIEGRKTFPAFFYNQDEEPLDLDQANEEQQDVKLNSGEVDLVTSQYLATGQELMSGSRVTFNENLLESQIVPQNRVGHFRISLPSKQSMEEGESANLKQAVRKPRKSTPEGLRSSYSLSKDPAEVDTERKAREQKINDISQSIMLRDSQVLKTEPALYAAVEEEDASIEASDLLGPGSRTFDYQVHSCRKNVDMVSQETQTEFVEIGNIEYKKPSKSVFRRKEISMGLALGGIMLIYYFVRKNRFAYLANMLFKRTNQA